MFSNLNVNPAANPLPGAETGNLFGSLKINEAPKIPEQEPAKPAEPAKPKDAWAMGANLIKF